MELIDGKELLEMVELINNFVNYGISIWGRIFRSSEIYRWRKK